MKKELKMLKTKFEAIVFTAITAWMMVYVMTLYNTVLATSSFTNSTFLIALKSMWIELVIVFLCAYFISSKVAKYFAFKCCAANRSRNCYCFNDSSIYGYQSSGTC